jgi:YVTN family beta-propeller protein
MLDNDSDILVLCEGPQGSNLASVYSYNIDNPNDYGKMFSSEQVIGDTGNDFIRFGDTLAITFSGSSSVGLFSISGDSLFYYIDLPGRATPRSIAKSQNQLYVTDLYEDQVWLIDLETKQVITTVSVGPSPEGIAYYNSKLIVANSGLGQIRSDEEGAGTIDIIDLKNSFLTRYSVGVNPEKVLVDEQNNRIYISYLSYYWLKNGAPNDSTFLGGIVEYSYPEFVELRKWRTTPIDFVLDNSSSNMFIITDIGLSSLDMLTPGSEITELATNGSDNWYSLYLDEDNNNLWIGNSKDYLSRGTIEIFSLNSSVFTGSIPTGFLPAKIIGIDQ